MTPESWSFHELPPRIEPEWTRFERERRRRRARRFAIAGAVWLAVGLTAAAIVSLVIRP